jgi:hypothetical protein
MIKVLFIVLKNVLLLTFVLMTPWRWECFLNAQHVIRDQFKVSTVTNLIKEASGSLATS